MRGSLQKVKTMLLFHRSVSAMTEVTTKDGIVTLQGDATSQAQKELTTEYAKDVEGVKDVNNAMAVSQTLKKTHQTTGEKIDDASITAHAKMALLYPPHDQCTPHHGQDKAWRGHGERQGQECSRKRLGDQTRQRCKGCEERKEPDDHRVVESRNAYIAGPIWAWATGLSNPEGEPNVVDYRCSTAILWALGLVSSYTMGGFIHILLVLAIIVIVINVIQGRRPG